MTTLTRSSNLELLDLPDCGGLLENGKCSWLNVSACTGEDCPYISKSGSQAKAYERLRNLDEQTQAHIAQKYFGGLRPWMRGKTKPRR